MNRFLVKRNVILTCLALMIYYGIMELYFYYFIGVSYSRFHMDLNISIPKYVETKVIFFGLLVVMLFIARKSEFIFAIFTFFMVFFLIPALVIYSFEDQKPEPLYACLALQLAIGFVSTQKIKIPKLESFRLSNTTVVFLVLLTLIPFIYSYGAHFNIGNLLLNDIDQTRAAYDENASGLGNYLYNWLVKAILPVVLIYLLVQRRHLYAFIAFFMLIYLYLISGNKIVYITTFVVLFFFFVGDNYLEKTKATLYGLIFILTVMPLIDFYILESHKLKGTFVQRMLFLPAQLNYLYFDFFADKPLYFAESNFFKWFVHNPYDKPVGFIIAETYFNAFDMNANNGIISDGFMNLGYSGVVINIFIVALVFLFFNSMNLEDRYLGIFFVIIFLFLSAPMLSMFITSGLWIIILMAMTIMRKSSTLN